MEIDRGSVGIEGAPTPCAVLRRFALLNGVLAAALVSRDLGQMRWMGAASIAFVLAGWIEYSALYLLPSFAPAFLLAWALRRRRVASWLPLALAALLATATQLLLFVDGAVFAHFGFHLNGFVWNLLRTPGGIESMDLDGTTTGVVAAVAGAIVVAELVALRVARGAPSFWARLAPRRPRRAAWLAFAAFATVAVGERFAYALANLADYRPILAAQETFPCYGRTRIRRLASLFGFEKGRHSGETVALAKGRVRYPAAPLELAPERPRWNVVWLVSESWRADSFEPDVMPETEEFARGAARFRQHVSGGNGTRMGVFSMFYGLYGAYWFPFLAENVSPVLVDTLLADGYQLAVSTSARFAYPEFDRTIWTRLPAAELVEGDAKKPGWENDRILVTRMLERIDSFDPSRPFFAFHFFESPHARYAFPPECAIRGPCCESMSYATLGRDDMPPVKNRYLNAVHHLDSQLGRVFRHLRDRGLLERTIVVVTGDHGEEFMEKGRYGHNSAFSEEQIRTPLLLAAPGLAPRVVDTPSSHLDLAPTVLRLLGVVNPPSDYCLGIDLLGGATRDHVVVADWNRLCVRDDSWKGILPVRQRGFFGIDVTTRDDAPSDDVDAYRASHREQFVEVTEGLARFVR